MKKFDRLPPDTRKAEIRQAALRLFNEKGFAATTMENIVSEVTLSKGGVYRLYSSTTAILGDLMLEGMRLRNAYYEQCALRERAAGRPLTPETLVGMVADSLLLYPEVSAVYVEFLWEKRRSPALESLYREICRESSAETLELIRRCGAEEALAHSGITMDRLTELMNAAVLSLHVLGLQQEFSDRRDALCRVILQLLQS